MSLRGGVSMKSETIFILWVSRKARFYQEANTGCLSCAPKCLWSFHCVNRACILDFLGSLSFQDSVLLSKPNF